MNVHFEWDFNVLPDYTVFVTSNGIEDRLVSFSKLATTAQIFAGIMEQAISNLPQTHAFINYWKIVHEKSGLQYFRTSK